MQGLLLFALGLLLFVPGAFKFLSAKGQRKTIQIFGIVAFIGLVLLLIGGAVLILSYIPGIPSKLITYVMFVGFAIGGIIFLRPGFGGKR